MVKLTPVTLQQPIDPRQMEDDEHHIDVSSLTGNNGGADPARVVVDVTADPRVFTASNPKPTDATPQQPAATPGVEFLPVSGPLLALPTRESMVRQLNPAAAAASQRSPEDAGLAEFVRSLDMDPSTMGLADAPAPAPAPVASPQPAPVAPAPGGSMIERGRNKALAILNALPAGVEISIGTAIGQDGVEFVMGLGLLAGSGHVVCRDGMHYSLKRG